jgi:precorrin-2 dehydrogenase/sirohydrochlorin ferrochelatase
MFLNLSGRTVVIVGGGRSAERKATAFLRYGADVVVISPEATDELRQMQADGLITLEPREYGRGDLEGVALVVCTDVSEEVSTAVFKDADFRGCPVNVGGSPERCNYLIPTSFRRGPLQIAISSSGAAPTVAKRLRDDLRARYGEEWGVYVALLGSVRTLAQDRILDPAERERVLADIAAADLLSRIAAGEVLDAEAVLAQFGPAADEAADTLGATASEDPPPTEPEE